MGGCLVVEVVVLEVPQGRAVMARVANREGEEEVVLAVVVLIVYLVVEEVVVDRLKRHWALLAGIREEEVVEDHH
jgi:hypothetical protein